MKTTLLTFVLCLLTAFYTSVLSQSGADKIIGYYTTLDDDTGDENSQIQIFKATNGKYYGKIVWLKEPLENGKPKIDDENPDKALQNKPIIGLQLLKGFVYDEKSGEWKNGTIYDPDNGKTYSCYIKFDGDKLLKIRGFIGKAWMGLGRTATWTKADPK
jgi:uncharacterized protein (DUF2147 family)